MPQREHDRGDNSRTKFVLYPRLSHKSVDFLRARRKDFEGRDSRPNIYWAARRRNAIKISAGRYPTYRMLVIRDEFPIGTDTLRNTELELIICNTSQPNRQRLPSRLC